MTCFLKEGQVEVAKLEETYFRALATLIADIDEVAVPIEVEPEEDLGLIDEADETPANVAPTFDIEVTGSGDDDSDVSDSSADSGSDSDDEVDAPIDTKRVRKQNTMTGSVKKGKYSTGFLR